MDHSTSAKNDTIGLAQCAVELKIPYQDAHRLLLVGRLSGVKRGGRWACSRESLDRLIREREGTPVAEAAT